MIQTSGTLDVQPGESLHKQIVCPKLAPRASVRLACDWPDELSSERLVLGLWFILIISKPCLAFSGRGPTQTGPSLLV